MYSQYAADNLIDTKVQKTHKTTIRHSKVYKLNLEASNDLFSKPAVRHALTGRTASPASANLAYSWRRLLPGASIINEPLS